MPTENEGFVSRWSRRKQQAKQPLEESIKAPQAQAPFDDKAIVKQAPEPALSPEEQRAQQLAELNKLTDADMPDIETLNEQSDFSGFMSTGVSEGLRRMALRKLFMGKSFNIRDGLDEYDGDYTFFESLPKNTVTTDMKHMMEVEAKRQLAKEQSAEAEELAAQHTSDLEDFDEFEDDDFDDGSDHDNVMTAELANTGPNDNDNVAAVQTHEAATTEFDEFSQLGGFDTTQGDDSDINTNSNISNSTKNNEEHA